MDEPSRARLRRSSTLHESSGLPSGRSPTPRRVLRTSFRSITHPRRVLRTVFRSITHPRRVLRTVFRSITHPRRVLRTVFRSIAPQGESSGRGPRSRREHAGGFGPSIRPAPARKASPGSFRPFGQPPSASSLPGSTGAGEGAGSSGSSAEGRRGRRRLLPSGGAMRSASPSCRRR
jgi:hypothetical protein